LTTLLKPYIIYVPYAHTKKGQRKVWGCHCCAWARQVGPVH
jgi:hypothetical protein